jgi:hypothetical protein
MVWEVRPEQCQSKAMLVIQTSPATPFFVLDAKLNAMKDLPNLQLKQSLSWEMSNLKACLQSQLCSGSHFNSTETRYKAFKACIICVGFCNDHSNVPNDLSYCMEGQAGSSKRKAGAS